MSLTGKPVLFVVALLLVGFTVVAIGDLPGLKAPRLLKRTISVLGAQVCAVLVAALAVNDWGMFYGSWSDLFGGSSDDVVTINADGHHAATGVPQSYALTAWSKKSELGSKGGVFQTTLQGASSHLSTTALVYLPPQYFDAKHANDRFPVVETVAGYPGDVPQLVKRLGYPAALKKAVDNGTTKPMILVMMKPTLVPPRDTECVDVPHGPQTLTFFSHDVPTLLKSELRVTDSGWGAMGHSTGGYCAAKLAMTNPTQFVTAVSLSGYFATHDDAATGSLFGGDERVAHENDLGWRLAHLPVPHVAILASIGQDERGVEGLEGNRAFISAVRPPMTAQLKVVQGGGHNFQTYTTVLPSAYAWLGAHLHFEGSDAG